MQHNKYLFAWGNPLVSHQSALAPTARAFIDWVQKQGLKPVWCCVDLAMEKVLANEHSWSGVQCVHEETLDPDHILELTNARGMEDVGVVKDLKKNLRRAERAGLSMEETTSKWNEKDRKQVEEGLMEWRHSKSAKGLQLASTTGQSWVDEAHRRYWVARHEGQIVGILILTPIQGPAGLDPLLEIQKTTSSYKRSSSITSTESSAESHPPSPRFSPQPSPSSSVSSFSYPGCHEEHATPSYYLIKNAISFPDAPRSTSEFLIHTCLISLAKASTPSSPTPTVTFGIIASEQLKLVDNLSGWKMNSLSTIYSKVAKGAGLWKRVDFRAKFD
ncbi:aspartate-trna ligase [Moniliophthora roreri MCA 2997]|uniref:Aspartate-trna ligase n=1 Tax=Moniliophthora roreri (strain MCA 2997) TaxID=1381753 RepID=V2X3A0_MONRO|nr:aspartate-trna ligase [Moniliophthora roreri MCA 2997]